MREVKKKKENEDWKLDIDEGKERNEKKIKKIERK